ncbi:MAG: phenylalanine--tRNA ligase beta subunit-related protein [Bacteroidetes bacterium]|nr:phenylalanine--tRNA ligase beta subunit-related protein [Bacteroidota bacterium]MDF1865238.1 phenylalanine--tRNA ligase beta subunit-related protein [Saprospiraceae bacterium]
MIQKETIIQETCPDLILGFLWGKVQVEASNQVLLQQISENIEVINANRALELVSQFPTIKTTRDAYRSLGKKPGRYRPSAEALTRRILQGKGLYQVNNVVDCLNLISVQSGYSIGGYDFDKIEGEMSLGRGRENEPYEAIGRGELNIHNLPILRDEKGAFGSPTSDSIRTMVTEQTDHFLMVFFNFGGFGDLDKWMKTAEKLFVKHCSGSAFDSSIF